MKQIIDYELHEPPARVSGVPVRVLLRTTGQENFKQRKRKKKKRRFETNRGK